MVYKPKKTVNGHKRDDRYTRSRKRAAAARKRAAAKPVRSNVKRYVAEQLDKIAPDNRYYFNVTEAQGAIKPLCQSTLRVYPFGASFQKRFLDMEFRRMKTVVQQGLSQYPQIGATEDRLMLPTQTDTQDYRWPVHSVNYLKNSTGNFNNWRSILGRGIHMKSSSVYGTVTLFPNKNMQSLTDDGTNLIEELRTADLTLHMFVLEDKAITKTEFMSWYQDLFEKKEFDGTWSTETGKRIGLVEDSWLGDTFEVPYRAGSGYLSNDGTATDKYVASTTRPDSPYGPTSFGDEEFLVDWRKFYKHDSNNPADEVFHNTKPCTTAWDGSYDKTILPINKSRFIVHEHKKWTIKPDSKGNVKRCFPWSYSFPEHYMTYEKELLDLPFFYSKVADSTDKQGIQAKLLFPRKQPYIHFMWSRCHKNGPHYVINENNDSGFAGVAHNDVFHIDMNMKCHYENPLATKNVPTINKGKPLVHKREYPKSRQSRPEPRKTNVAKKLSRRSSLPTWMQGPKPSNVPRDTWFSGGAPQLSSADREIATAAMDYMSKQFYK